MSRPTFIIAEPEPIGALSARKLVVETAKFNVITGHSRIDLWDLLKRFPAVDAVVVHTDLLVQDLASSVKELKQVIAGKPLILVSPNIAEYAGYGDHLVSSHEPQDLLQLLRRLFGDPRSKEAVPQERGVA